MAAFTSEQTVGIILSTGIVPVYFNAEAGAARMAIKACYDGGIRAFEFTNRGPEALAVFKTVIDYVRENCPGMAFGAGTILNAEAAEAFSDAGADFLVSPCMVSPALDVARSRAIPYCPGCGTVTEIFNAVQAGCPIVKVFPAGSVGGPAFVRDVLAPLPGVHLLCTGAVEPSDDNVRAWAAAGAAALGMGSKLFPKGASLERVSELCALSLKWFAESRK